MENKLIEQLATKLGTTVEFLWGILIKQAFVSACFSLGYVLFVIIYGVIIFKLHLKFSNETVKETKYGKDTVCDYDNDSFIIPMVVFFTIWVGFAIGALCSIYNVFLGFFNPEYWALNEILNTIK